MYCGQEQISFCLFLTIVYKTTKSHWNAHIIGNIQSVNLSKMWLLVKGECDIRLRSMTSFFLTPDQIMAMGNDDHVLKMSPKRNLNLLNFSEQTCRHKSLSIIMQRKFNANLQTKVTVIDVSDGWFRSIHFYN